MEKEDVSAQTHKLKIMSGKGHTVVEWDTAVEATVAEAEAIVREHQAKGSAIFAHDGQGNHTKVTVWDPTLEDVLVVPAMMGGSR